MVSNLFRPLNCSVIAWSKPLLVPAVYVRGARWCDFSRITVGGMIADIAFAHGAQCDPCDPHAFLTNGATTRKMFLVEAMKRLFANPILGAWLKGLR